MLQSYTPVSIFSLLNRPPPPPGNICCIRMYQYQNLTYIVFFDCPSPFLLSRLSDFKPTGAISQTLPLAVSTRPVQMSKAQRMMGYGTYSSHLPLLCFNCHLSLTTSRHLCHHETAELTQQLAWYQHSRLRFLKRTGQETALKPDLVLRNVANTDLSNLWVDLQTTGQRALKKGQAKSSLWFKPLWV